MILITIIIPIYNASHTLPKCIDSILSQTLCDWTLFLVDDGSSDESLEIMNAYKDRDARIKVFHKENEGVSIARQYGLDRVETPFFIYCDADDYVEPTYLEDLFTSITKNNADLSICAYIEEYEDRLDQMDTPESSVDGLIHNFLNDKVWGVTWNKLYKTKIVKENNLKFIPHIQMWEDLAFTIDYCLCSSSVSFVHKPLYHYVKTLNTSITQNENIAKKKDRVLVIRHFESSMRERGKIEQFEESLLNVKYHISYLAINHFVSQERLLYFKTSFPEIFNSLLLFRKHPLVISIAFLNLERLFYVGYYARLIKQKLGLWLKKIIK